MLGQLLQRAVRDPGWAAWARGDDFAPGMSPADPHITKERAQKLLTVHGCVSFISDAISVMPVDIVRERAGKKDMLDTPFWLEQPNPEADRVVFVGQIISSLLYTGNAYLLPMRGSLYDPLEVWVLDPDSVSVQRDPKNRRAIYTVLGQRVDELIHVRGFTMPGELLGLDPIRAAAYAITLGLNLTDYSRLFFAQGAIPPGVIETPGELTEETAAELKRRWISHNAGLMNAHTPGILTGGASFKQVQVAPEQAQFLESKNFTSAEIAAGLFRVPPEMVGLSLPNNATITYQNIEARWAELGRRTFLPWVVRIERALSLLFPRGTEVKLSMDAYLRADTKTRYETHEIAVRSGIASPNERRQLEDMEPYEGGDVYVTPGTGTQFQNEPTEAPPADQTDDGERDSAVAELREKVEELSKPVAPKPPTRLKIIRDRTGQLAGVETV